MAKEPSPLENIPNNTAPQWYKDPGLRANVAHCLGLCLVIYYLGYDAGLLNGLQALEAWNKIFNYPTGAILGVYAASLYLPSIITAYIGDILSERFGRKLALAVGSVLVFGGALLNALATNPGMWIAGRAIMGAGGGIAKVAAPALIQEIAHPRLRPMLACCYYPFFYFGSLLSALLCFAALYIPNDWSWRMPSLVQTVGPLMVLATLIRCPESPRWLVSKGRVEEASNVLAKYHANGDTDDYLVRWELVQIETSIESETTNHQVSYLDFFRTKGNRRRLVVLLSLSIGSNWVGNGIISYYLTPVLRSVGIESPVKLTLLTSGLAIWNLILAFGAALNVERFGRRPLFLISIIGMLLSYVVVMGLSAGFANSKSQALGTAVIPCLFIYYGFYDIAWTPLPVPYTAEILPFSFRTKGLALFTSFGTMANAFNQFVNPIALDALEWKYYAVYIVILSFYLVFAYFMYPETKNLTIEEVSVVFDKTDGDIRRLHESALHQVKEGDIESAEHEEDMGGMKKGYSHRESIAKA